MSHSNNDIDNTNYWDIILSSNTIYEMTSYSSKNSRIEELLRISCDLYVNNIHINTHQLIDIYNQGFSSHEIYQVIHELFGDSSAYKALLPKNYENVYSNTLYKSHKDHLQAYLILKKTLANIGITAHKNIINELLYNITVGNLGAFIENNIAQPLLKIIKNVYELGKVDDVYSHISRVSYVINISIPKNKNSATIQCIAKSNIISPGRPFTSNETLPNLENFTKYENLFNRYSKNNNPVNDYQKFTSLFNIEYTITALDNNKVQYKNLKYKLIIPNYPKQNNTLIELIIEKLRILLHNIWNIITRNKQKPTLYIGKRELISSINDTLCIQHTCKNKVILSCYFHDSDIINTFLYETDVPIAVHHNNDIYTL